MSTCRKKAGGGNPPATTARQPLPYRQLRVASRADLSRAAEVLYFLMIFDVSETTQVGLFALLDRRLRRAYEGVTR
jgi:hypothetical protein